MLYRLNGWVGLKLVDGVQFEEILQAHHQMPGPNLSDRSGSCLHSEDQYIESKSFYRLTLLRSWNFGIKSTSSGSLKHLNLGDATSVSRCLLKLPRLA